MTFAGIVRRGDAWPVAAIAGYVNTDDELSSRARYPAPARRNHPKEASA